MTRLEKKWETAFGKYLFRVHNNPKSLRYVAARLFWIVLGSFFAGAIVQAAVL